MQKNGARRSVAEPDRAAARYGASLGGLLPDREDGLRFMWLQKIECRDTHVSTIARRGASSSGPACAYSVTHNMHTIGAGKLRGNMMRKHTTLNLDMDLVDAAAAELGTSRITETVHRALAETIDRARPRRLASRSLPGLTPDSLNQMREHRSFDDREDQA